MDACKRKQAWHFLVEFNASIKFSYILFTLHKATKCVLKFSHTASSDVRQLETGDFCNQKKMAILHIMENLPAVLDFFSSCNMIAVACCSRLLLLLKKK